MHPCHPNPIPKEPGCLVSRVTKPESAFDQFHSTTWACVVWIEGRAWGCHQASPLPPTFSDLFISHNTMPVLWTAL